MYKYILRKINLRAVYKFASILAFGLFIPIVGVCSENVMRDPTQPSSYSDNVVTIVPSSDIIITAVFVGKDKKIVMIGNHPFTIGEKVSGQTIIDIDAKGITLKNEDGSERRVDMLYSTIKLPTTNNKQEKP